MKQDPAHPFHGNLDGPGQVTIRLGNTDDPVLKPWAAAQMRASNEEAITGKRAVPFTAQGRCYPGGVPGQLLYPAEPFYFIQTPKEVWMIWQRDHLVRRVYLTDKHSADVKPSWFGESIGHYENGDTLVVDTIGLSAKNSFIDNFRTPHTTKEHVVERFKPSADGKMLDAAVTVDDPDTFNEPLHLRQAWRKVDNPMLETACAEQRGLFPSEPVSDPGGRQAGFLSGLPHTSRVSRRSKWLEIDPAKTAGNLCALQQFVGRGCNTTRIRGSARRTKLTVNFPEIYIFVMFA